MTQAGRGRGPLHGAWCGWTTRQPTVGPTTGTKVINRVCHISMVCERACEKRRRRYAEGAEEKVCVRNPLWPAHPHPGGFLLLHCNCYILRCRCMHRATRNAPAHSAVVSRSTSHPPQTAQHTRSMQHSTQNRAACRTRTHSSLSRQTLARSNAVCCSGHAFSHTSGRLAQGAQDAKRGVGMSKIMLYAIRSNLRSKTTQDEEQRIIYARQVVKSDLAKGKSLAKPRK